MTFHLQPTKTSLTTMGPTQQHIRPHMVFASVFILEKWKEAHAGTKEGFQEVTINKLFLSMTSRQPLATHRHTFSYLISNLFCHIWLWSQHTPNVCQKKQQPLNWESAILDLLAPIKPHTNLRSRPCKSGWALIKAPLWILHGTSCIPR